MKLFETYTNFVKESYEKDRKFRGDGALMSILNEPLFDLYEKKDLTYTLDFRTTKSSTITTGYVYKDDKKYADVMVEFSKKPMRSGGFFTLYGDTDMKVTIIKNDEQLYYTEDKLYNIDDIAISISESLEEIESGFYD